MGIEDKLVEGWVDDEQQTFGQRFVERFPSQIKDDPELKMKQERNVQWLIDTLVPQSGSDVAITAGKLLNQLLVNIMHLFLVLEKLRKLS